MSWLTAAWPGASGRDFAQQPLDLVLQLLDLSID
jgi:hypothetical protein